MANRKKKATAITKESPIKDGTGNVFEDLGFADAGDLQIKAELTRQLYNRITYFGLTQAEAAKRLGLQQPDVSKLMNGRFTGFSTDRLMTLLTSLMMDIEIVIRPRRNSLNPRGAIRVLAKSAA
jgi:predicted XRE-type DNA-binding protein